MFDPAYSNGRYTQMPIILHQWERSFRSVKLSKPITSQQVLYTEVLSIWLQNWILLIDPKVVTLTWHYAANQVY